MVEIGQHYVKLSVFLKENDIAHRSVMYAQQKGKLPSLKKVGRYWYAHKTETLRELNENRDPVAIKKSKGKKRGPRKAEPDKEKRPSKKKKMLLDDTEKVAPKTFDGLTFADAERQEKVYKARMAQLKFEESAGNLISTEKVKLAAFEIARKTRDAILSIPGKVAHELAAETDPHRLEHTLFKELNQALEKLVTTETVEGEE